MRRIRNLTGLVVLAVLSAGLLTGCGTDNKTTTSPVTTQAQTVQPAESQTVKPTESQTAAPKETTAPAQQGIIDLQEKRSEILAGKVIALNEDGSLYDGFGFTADMISGGKAETITVREGRYKDGSAGWELYCDEAETGYSSYLTRMETVQSFPSLEWPDEANFRKEDGCRLYLVSLDGKKLSLAVEGKDEIWVIGFAELKGDGLTGKPIVAVARLRGKGKSIHDLTPCLSPEEYVAVGWEVRPFQGDQIDLTGDGKKESVNLYYEASGTPFREWIGVVTTAREGTAVSYVRRDASNVLLNEFRYEHLYYVARPDGGYDLRGEITVNGEQISVTFTAEKNAEGVWKLAEVKGN